MVCRADGALIGELNWTIIADQLTITVREQEQIEQGLERLRRLMREWQSYEGVVRGIRRLREDEKRIIEELTDSKKSR